MFEKLRQLPEDPLLGLITRFNSDQNPLKIDLGVGVYKDESGQTPVLDCVKKAEQLILQKEESKSYVGAMGNMGFNQSMGKLVLGAEHKALEQGRFTFLQTPGGCGALRVAAELMMRMNASARIWVSDPTWANHIPLLGNAGLDIQEYPYYDYAHHSIRFEAMCDRLMANAKRGDYVLLHGCCHNPCGADLSLSQWQKLANLMRDNGLIPFIDMAYQGFGDGVEEDAAGARLIANMFAEAIICVSCSKSFGLYRERVGAVGVLGNDSAEVKIAVTHLTNIVRGIYSMPPSHGASIVDTILNDSTLTANWHAELELMRERISLMRQKLIVGCNERGINGRFDFIGSEKGMFSFLGITPEQVNLLATKKSIYMAESSRICVAGLTLDNLEYFCDSLVEILG